VVFRELCISATICAMTTGYLILSDEHESHLGMAGMVFMGRMEAVGAYDVFMGGKLTLLRLRKLYTWRINWFVVIVGYPAWLWRPITCI